MIKLVESIKSGNLMHFLKVTGILLAGVFIALMINLGNIWGTYEYSKVTMRGQSELTLDGKNKRNGLDPEYITNWSYGIGETWNLMIPNFKGGSSSEPISEEKDALKNVDPQYKQIVGGLPQYFGDMPFTSGPYYIGVVVIMLFLLSVVFLKGTLKWMAIISILIAIPLSWGKHLMWLTDFFIEYIPLYNKFRTVPMIQVMVELMIPIFGIRRIGSFDQS